MVRSVSVPADEQRMTQLWTRFRADDERAFDQLVEARYRVLFNYAARFTRDRALVKDCIQDLFLELWNRRKAIVDTPYVTIYLIKALRNNLVRKLNRERGWTLAVEEDLNLEYVELQSIEEQTIESSWIARETQTRKEHTLRDAVALLPRRQQEVVFLKFYEGLSNDDIAQVMDVEKQTVANFLYRALTQLRNSLPVRIFS